MSFCWVVKRGGDGVGNPYNKVGSMVKRLLTAYFLSLSCCVMSVILAESGNFWQAGSKLGFCMHLIDFVLLSRCL